MLSIQVERRDARSCQPQSRYPFRPNPITAQTAAPTANNVVLTINHISIDNSMNPYPISSHLNILTQCRAENKERNILTRPSSPPSKQYTNPPHKSPLNSISPSPSHPSSQPYAAQSTPSPSSDPGSPPISPQLCSNHHHHPLLLHFGVLASVAAAGD